MLTPRAWVTALLGGLAACTTVVVQVPDASPPTRMTDDAAADAGSTVGAAPIDAGAEAARMNDAADGDASGDIAVDAADAKLSSYCELQTISGTTDSCSRPISDVSGICGNISATCPGFVYPYGCQAQPVGDVGRCLKSNFGPAVCCEKSACVLVSEQQAACALGGPGTPMSCGDTTPPAGCVPHTVGHGEQIYCCP